MTSKTHLDDVDDFGGDYPGSNNNSGRPGDKRAFGDLDDEENDLFGSKKGKLKVEESGPGATTGMILSLRESLQNCKDDLATCQVELEATRSEIQKWHSAFQNGPATPGDATPDPGLVLTYLQNLKSSEESLKEKLEKSKKKEAAFIVAYAKREQEIADLKMSTRVLPSKESKTRREVLVWTTHMDNVFIESMLFQHREGNHQDGVFSSCAYNDMLKDMNEKFPSMNIKRENLKNRLKTIKQNFSKCYDIFKSASNSRFGWNPESKKWEAEPEVWEILVQSKPEAAEWRIKSINKYDELEELFAKDRATGEGAETAKEKKRRWAKTKANSVCEDNVDIVDGIDFLLSRNEINLEGFSGEFEGDNVDVEILPDVPSSQVPSQSGATSSKGKRRKNETLEEGLITSLDKIANAIERSTDAILQSSASLGRFRSRVISSEEITEALEEMGVEGQFFDDAFEFLTDNPEKAKKIFGYPKMGRLRYLEKLVYPTHGTS